MLVAHLRLQREADTGRRARPGPELEHQAVIVGPGRGAQEEELRSGAVDGLDDARVPAASDTDGVLRDPGHQRHVIRFPRRVQLMLRVAVAVSPDATSVTVSVTANVPAAVYVWVAVT